MAVAVGVAVASGDWVADGLGLEAAVGVALGVSVPEEDAEGDGVAVATAGTLGGVGAAVAAMTPAPTPAIAARPSAHTRIGRPGRDRRVAICFGRVATCPLELTPSRGRLGAHRRTAAG